MKYGELVHFEPVESVIELREANKEAVARKLVETFVISDRMAEALSDVVFPQLQFERPADNKAILIVGNYGTGKSHLMAVLSSVAERAALASSFEAVQTAASGRAKDAEAKKRFEKLAKTAKEIAGRFQVARVEIGSTTMSLRDILCGALETRLASLGVDFKFKAANDVSENKGELERMMAAFEKQHPNDGILLVVDELLDFLRSRGDSPLLLDLGFLREIGEFSKTSRFRFVAGLQESLFDSDRFQFASDSLRRVKDRFEQIRISREDIAHVVAERLLRKDEDQSRQIRDHLSRFTHFFGSMAERLDDFVRLFPVHPAYLETFERISVAEKREVLKTLSRAISKKLDQTVPENEPGLVAFDSYWSVLKDNPSFRAEPTIKKVIDRADKIEGILKQSFSRPKQLPVALRIVHALAIHRLTTGEINTPIGLTPEALRDELALLPPAVNDSHDADFIKSLIESILAEILKTVSGQFISVNKENGQYFLDIEKDVDFDALIEKRAAPLDAGELDRHYHDALARVLECSEGVHVPGYKIWEYELEWKEKKAGRSGYLFFGAPNERSTAQPPRDFYVYFLQPFEVPKFKDEKKADEVFFRLAHPDEAFERSVRLYAAARELQSSSSGSNKKIYADKGDGFLKDIVKWLGEKLPSAFEVVYQGRSQLLANVVQGKLSAAETRGGVRDIVNLAASLSLSPRFQDVAPDYPTFSVSITRENREQAAQEALRWIAGGVKSKPGTAVLDALELLDGETLRPARSKYAKAILEDLSRKGTKQVLNRSDLLREESGVEFWHGGTFRLEPELLAVILAALVHAGEVVVVLPGKKLDAANLRGELTRLPVKELASFKGIERPRDLPLAPLQRLFELLGLTPGLVVSPDKHEEAVRALQGEVNRRLEAVAKAEAELGNLRFWGRSIFSDAELAEWRGALRKWKEFVESLQVIDSPGKLKNFGHEVAAIDKQKAGIDRVAEAEGLAERLGRLAGKTSYVEMALALLPAEHEWSVEARKEQINLVAAFSGPATRLDPALAKQAGERLDKLAGSYREIYLALHRRSRLAAADDKKKANLAKDPRLKNLRALSKLEVFPGRELEALESELFHQLKTCPALAPGDLESAALCPHCGFRPSDEPIDRAPAPARLAAIDEKLDAMLSAWTGTLLSELDDPTAAASIELLGAAEKKAVKKLLKDKDLPDTLGVDLQKALQEVLAGLEPVKIDTEALRKALAGDGGAVAIPDIEDRFKTFLAEKTRGKDASKVRILLG